MGPLARQHEVVLFADMDRLPVSSPRFLAMPELFLTLAYLHHGVPKSSFMHLSKFIGQYHIERYMLGPAFPNVVTRCADLAPTLAAVVSEAAKARTYSARRAHRLPVKSLPGVANVFRDVQVRG